MQFSLKSLEFNKILEKVAKYSKSKIVSNFILNLKPNTNKDKIITDLKEVDCAKNTILENGIINILPDYDIDKELKGLDIGSILSIKEILKIKNIILISNYINKYYKTLKEQNLNIDNLTKYFKNIKLLKELNDEINRIIDTNNNIYDNASQNLMNIRKKIIKTNNLLDKKLEELKLKYSKYLKNNKITFKDSRPVLIVSSSYKNKIKGIVHGRSASAQSYYIEPDEIRNITILIENLKIEEEEEINKILSNLTNYIYQYKDDLIINQNLIRKLDFIFSKAQYAIEINADIPSFNEKDILKLYNARHPLIDKKTVIPIDFILKDNKKIMIITGPNTGGKTASLKTLGLLTIMAQSGLLIPASSHSNLKIFNNIYADIGDEQSLEQSLSTFSSHMTKIIKIVDNVSENDLVLLDELGSGTDPNEGTALAISIIEYLKKNGPTVVVSTHYSELKLYAYKQDDIEIASVSFDKVTLKPLYYLQIGISGNSNALLISKRLGLKKEILNQAKQLVSGQNNDINKLLKRLENEQKELFDLKKELNLKEKELNNLIKKYKNMINDNSVKQNEILNKIKESETKIWKEKKDELNKLIIELKEKNLLKTKDEAKIKGKLKTNNKTKINIEYNFKKDDYVYIQKFNKKGKILKIENGKYLVDLGPFNLKFNKEDLQITAMPIKEKKSQIINYKPKDKITRQYKLNIDLRGYRYIDVKEALDMAINDCLLNNSKTITVIHGHGSGALKKAVKEYIKNSKYIKSSRSGGLNEGLDGVTIINLK